ncbi:MAG: Smr/MutS family protein [Burkholderiaceae bacterium]
MTRVRRLHTRPPGLVAAPVEIIQTSADDPVLFAQAVAGAVPLAQKKHPLAGVRPKPAPIPRQRIRDEQAALAESQLSDITPDSLLDSDDALSFARNGISRDTLRRLRRGHWSLQGQLDLHGMRTDEAREALAAFIQQCHRSDRRCLRVIHGKGLGSIGKEPVLKAKVRSWLMQKKEVLAFCQAPAHEGGSGAVIVLLKSAQPGA